MQTPCLLGDGTDILMLMSSGKEGQWLWFMGSIISHYNVA